MIAKNKVGLVTTVSNWALYKRTRPRFPRGIKIFAIDGTTGFYGLNSLTFFLKKLKKYDLDWLIMADEDVIFLNSERVFDLIDFLHTKDYTVAGMRDGGVLKWRNKNPYVINHFFAVINLREVYEIYEQNEMLKNQYVLENEFSELDLPYNNYERNSLFEPYYCFYLWLLRKGKKIKYLDAHTPVKDDFATTLLHDQAGGELLYHTWYARFYKKDKFHTARINRILDIAGKIPEKDIYQDPIILKHPFYDLKYALYSLRRRAVRNFRKL